jgi:general secretion pathway protein A
LLTNFEDRQEKHVHVVLLGQPELRDRVRKRPQIDQRVSLRFHIEPMEADEVGGYVKHRLQVAGRTGDDIFTSGALAVLAARSGGVPRRINTLATQGLFVGAMRRLHQIDEELMTDVADDQE